MYNPNPSRPSAILDDVIDQTTRGGTSIEDAGEDIDTRQPLPSMDNPEQDQAKPSYLIRQCPLQSQKMIVVSQTLNIHIKTTEYTFPPTKAMEKQCIY